MVKRAFLLLLVLVAMSSNVFGASLVLNYTGCNVVNNGGTVTNNYAQNFILNASGTGMTNITWEVRLTNSTAAALPAGTTYEVAVFYNESVTNASKVPGCSVTITPSITAQVVACGSGNMTNISFPGTTCLLNISGNYTVGLRIQNEGAGQFFSQEDAGDPYQQGHCFGCAGLNAFSTRTMTFRLWSESSTSKGFTVANGQYNTTTVESKLEQYLVNLTWGSNITAMNATLVWNGSEQSTSQIASGGSFSTYSAAVRVPLTSNNSKVAWYWNLSIFNTSSIILNDTGAGDNVTIAEMLVSNCTVNMTQPTGVNFTINDEQTGSLITTASSFLETVFYTFLSSMTRTQNVSWSPLGNAALCIHPGNATFAVSGTISYEAPGYFARQFVFDRNLTSSTLNITLLLLAENASTLVTFNVVDSSEIPIVSYPVEIYKYTLGTGVQTLVGGFTSDVAGQGVVPLLINQYYIYKVYDTSGNLVLNQGPEFLTTSSKTLVVGEAQSVNLGDWLTLYGLDCDLGFNNATNVLSTNWTHNGSITNFCMGVFNLSSGMTLLNSQCSANDTGSLTYNLTDGDVYFGVDIATLEDGTQGVVYCNGANPLTVDLRPDPSPFGLEGVFWAFILLVFFAYVGVSVKGKEYTPLIAMILWMAVVAVFRLIPFTLTMVMGLSCMFIVWIFAMRRERE